MRILIAGASGLIGSALVPALRAHGHEVRRLVRAAPGAADETRWSPAEGALDPSALDGVDAIINLAGENLGAGRWTAARREAILRSRTDTTRTLVRAVAAAPRRPHLFVNASATGFYGDRGDEELTEASGIGHGFPSEVCLAWETHAEGAARLGLRTVLLRFGLVLAVEGGVLGRMLPLFRRGLGGRLGRGRHWMSWISREDALRAILFVLGTPSLAGPVNVTAPAPATNAEFSLRLARALRRPPLLPVPALALRLRFGRRMADEMLLASFRVRPARLLAAGFAFHHPTLDVALPAIVSS